MKTTVSALEKHFGALVRGLRIKKRFTQEGFADHLGIDRSYAGKIERGQVSVTLRTADVIAKGLGLKISELMTLLDKERGKSKDNPSV